MSRTRRLTIVAQDPSVRTRSGILRAAVDVPAEELAPGPRGARVHVIDYDASAGLLYRPLPLNRVTDPFARASDTRLLCDPNFHAQNAYAVVMRTLARFEEALGRRVGWSFPGHQLKVAPHAFADANAFYSRQHEALLFGYFQGSSGETVFTSLAHDVIAHETTHALVDGLRERYLDPSSPQQAGFHEGFADIVALLSIYSLPEVVAAVRPARLTLPNLRRSALLGLAKQMGQEMPGVRGNALRRSASLRPSPDYLRRPEFREPHRLGELLAAAVMNAFLHAWLLRLGGSRRTVRRVVEEGAGAADHLLTMCIRALDYCPPTDLRFSDFLSALLTADRELHPDDSRYRYRAILRRSFSGYGIRPTSKGDGSGETGVWEPPGVRLSYAGIHFDSLRRDLDEVFRFIWQNRKQLGLCGDAFTRVQSVRPCLRAAMDGFALRETVAEYIQSLTLRAGELGRLGIARPGGMPADLDVTLYGGGALIFDEFGRLKFHVRNKILNTKRQSERLRYLWRCGALANKGASL